MVCQWAFFQVRQGGAGVADLAHQGGAAVAQGLDPLDDTLFNCRRVQGLPLGQGRLQPVFPALLRRDATGQGGKLQMGMTVDQTRQNGAFAMVADQPFEARQDLPGRAYGHDFMAPH